MNLKRHHHDAFESLPSVMAAAFLVAFFVFLALLLSGCETVEIIQIARRFG